MVWLKRSLVMLAAMGMLVFGCFALAGCGEQVAATWAHGDVKEDQVTTTIENMRTNYGLTDASSWQTFIENRSYDPDAASSDDSSKSKDANKGTVADLRTYVINQIIRQDIIEWEVKEQNIQPSDEEVEARVDEARKSVESQYMAGVFESYLQQQGFKDLDAYKDQVREQLAEEKLEQQATGSTTDSDAWDKYVDGLVSYADVKINDAPANLSYDPANTSSSDSSDNSSSDNSSN